MKRIETNIENVKQQIADFYRPHLQHFIVMNAVDMGDVTEVQWFFADYEPPCEVTAYCAKAARGELIPSMKEIIASAWAAEAELADLFDLNIENTEKGFVLEPDSPVSPLRRN